MGRVTAPVATPGSARSDTRNWVLVFAGTFVASLVLGWLLPDGINFFVKLTGGSPTSTTPLTRFFCFALSFVLMLMLELLIWIRAHEQATKEAMEATVRDGLRLQAAEVVNSSMLRALVPSRAANPQAAAETAGLISELSRTVGEVPASLVPGYSVLLRDGMKQASMEASAALNAGQMVDIRRHLEITRNLAHQASYFTQINRRTFDVPAKWTQEWLALVDEFGAWQAPATYIVLMESGKLAANKEDLQSMKVHLESRKWIFECCELEGVLDTFGGKLPNIAENTNIDVFGDAVAKLQTPPKGEYRGGIELKLRLLELSDSPELKKFIDAVTSFSRPASAFL